MRKSMIKTLTVFASVVLSSFCHAGPPFKVALIDDGVDLEVQQSISKNICAKGSYDFVEESPIVTSSGSGSGHGDMTATALSYSADTDNFCIMIYKIGNIKHFPLAINKAVENGAKIISLSMYSLIHDPELDAAVVNADKHSVAIYAAAGNSNVNLNEVCNVYPQCLKRKNVVVVGGLDLEYKKEIYSNYGTLVVDLWEVARDLNGRPGGTSIATPIAVGKYIKSLNLDKGKKSK